VQPDHSYTIQEFCEAERISRSILYRLWEQGRGPRSYHVGTRCLVSAETRAAWRRMLEAETAAE